MNSTRERIRSVAGSSTCVEIPSPLAAQDRWLDAPGRCDVEERGSRGAAMLGAFQADVYEHAEGANT